MFALLFRFIATIVANVAMLWIFALYFYPTLGFMLDPLTFDITNPSNLIGLFILGLTFWIGLTILKPIVKLLTFPLRFITLGLSNIFVNVGILYLIKYVTQNYLAIGYTISLGTVLQTFMLSVVLSVVMTVLERILKKIF